MKKRNVQWDVLGLGTVVMDHLLTLPGPLEHDEKHEVEIHHRQVGGPVPTALVLMQRWGLKTSFIGGWSDDIPGVFIDVDLDREGVHTGFASRTTGGHSGFAHVWIDPVNSTRTIAYHRAGGHWDGFNTDHIPWSSIRLLHLDGWPTGISLNAARAAKEQGCKVSLDTGSVKPNLEKLIPLVDVMNCTCRFLHAFLQTKDPEAGARRLAGMGPKTVTVTDGKNGAWMLSGGKIMHHPAIAIEAVDTTGAGDTFAGAIIYGLLQEWSPDKILRTACNAATLKCRKLGNRDAMPTLEESMKDEG